MSVNLQYNFNVMENQSIYQPEMFESDLDNVTIEDLNELETYFQKDSLY